MRSLVLVLSALNIVVVAGCQKQLTATADPQQPYQASRTTVIGTDASGNAVDGSTSEAVAPGDCVSVGSQCVDTSSGTSGSQFCQGGPSGGPVDSIVVDGKVVQTVCYPPSQDGKTDVVSGNGNVSVPQNKNNTTVTFDASTDGKPITGDVSVDGNNVAIYGNGADNTIIDGNVVLDGNNVRIRGVTIKGNLTLSKNNTAAVLVKVLGNVEVDGENDVFTAGDVFGTLTVTKNNVTLVSNRVQGSFSAPGNNPDCVDNKAFTDTNQDHDVQESEVGAALTCGG